MIFTKKAISPVVATALLLVVAVVAVVGFQTWFNTYQSNQLTEIEAQADAGAAVTLDRLEPNGLYLFNKGAGNVTISEVEIGGQDCITSETQLAPGVQRLPCDLVPSAIDVRSTQEVIVVAEGQGVFSYVAIVRSSTE